MAERYDLVVIGGGSGGLAAAQRAAEYGARALVIERGRLGGTCVNVGCVPKKVMWHAASFAHAFEDACEYGFDLPSTIEHDWPQLKAKRDAYVKHLNGIYARNLANKQVDCIAAEAKFAGAKTVLADGREFNAPHIIIATGGRPLLPELPGAELGISSDGFFELEELPQHVAIAGAGYIAVELAGMLRALGAEVTLFFRYASLLRDFDEVIQRGLMESLEDSGIRLRPNTRVEQLERVGRFIEARLGNGETEGGFDTWLWAIGRVPETEAIGLETVGVETDTRGFIPTDQFQTTNVPGIYAIGDVTGRAALTPVAIAAGRRLSDRLFGGMADRHLDYKNIPSVVFSHPPIGSCGMTEAEARQAHGDAVQIFSSEFVPLANGITEHKPKTRMKLITVGDEQKVVGVHLIGPGSDEMLQGFAVAIRMGACKRDFDDTVAIHPTSAEELVTLR